MSRVLTFAAAFLALTLLLSGSAIRAGEKNTHEGKIVNIKGQTLTMESKGKEHAHEVVPNAKITCDGKNCKLADLKAGELIRVTVDDTNRATQIVATTKDSLPKQE